MRGSHWTSKEWQIGNIKKAPCASERDRRFRGGKMIFHEVYIACTKRVDRLSSDDWDSSLQTYPANSSCAVKRRGVGVQDVRPKALSISPAGDRG